MKISFYSRADRPESFPPDEPHAIFFDLKFALIFISLLFSHQAEIFVCDSISLPGVCRVRIL